jgi:hypothetical protein
MAHASHIKLSVTELRWKSIWTVISIFLKKQDLLYIILLPSSYLLVLVGLVQITLSRSGGDMVMFGSMHSCVCYRFHRPYCNPSLSSDQQKSFNRMNPSIYWSSFLRAFA